MTNVKSAFEVTQILPPVSRKPLPWSEAADRYKLACKAAIQAKDQLDKARLIVEAMTLQFARAQRLQEEAGEVMFDAAEAEYYEFNPHARKHG